MQKVPAAESEVTEVRASDLYVEPTAAECLLTVAGGAALLNTFDKAFRSGIGPQWADRPSSSVSRYSLHALFPVPEEVQCRGFSTAGRLWCESYWETEGDLRDMQVKRVLGERRYAEICPECGETMWNGRCENPDCHYHWHPKEDETPDAEDHII